MADQIQDVMTRRVFSVRADTTLQEVACLMRDQDIGDDESLLRTGVISSLGMMEVVGWVEESFGVTVEPEEITEQNFDTLRGIARFVRSKSGVPAT